MGENKPPVTPQFRYGTLDTMDDSFDITFWRSVSVEEKFKYTWRLSEIAAELQGKSLDELRLQRAIGGLQRIRS